MTRSAVSLEQLPMLARSPWQMSYGERTALDGVLAQVRPGLAIEIGTAEGGSLVRVASWSEEVHSFDLVPPDDEVARLPNVTRHTGDSHALLPTVLDELAAAGRNVDFLLVDGDHSAEGVRQDIEDILESEAVRDSVILLHDTMNDIVREGINAVEYARYDKVALVDLDFVPGYLARSEPYRLQLWGGLGLIVVDAGGRLGRDGDIRNRRFHDIASIMRPARDEMRKIESSGVALDGLEPDAVEEALRTHWAAPDAAEEPGDASTAEEAADASTAELQRLQAELALCNTRLAHVEKSLSWRVTAPLRSLKRWWHGYRVRRHAQ